MKKIVFLPRKNLFVFANEQTYRKVKINQQDNSLFCVGNLYKLKGFACDGFTMQESVYQLIKEIDMFNGASINGLIMKPIDTPNVSRIFSLTREDCAQLGVEYEPHLQLFSKELSWEKINENTEEVADIDRPFNENDLSTYPVDENDLTIHKMIIRLSGFRFFAESQIITPSNNNIYIEDFLKTLEISVNPQLVNMGGNNLVNGRIITQCFSQRPYIVDSNNSIFIEIDLSHVNMSTNQTVGIKPSILRGKTINDLLRISWMEEYIDKNLLTNPYWFRKYTLNYC